MGQTPSKYRYVVAKNADDEGFFLVWDRANNNTDFTESGTKYAPRSGETGSRAALSRLCEAVPLPDRRRSLLYQIRDGILAGFGLDMKSEPVAGDDEWWSTCSTSSSRPPTRSPIVCLSTGSPVQVGRATSRQIPFPRLPQLDRRIGQDMDTSRCCLGDRGAASARASGPLAVEGLVYGRAVLRRCRSPGAASTTCSKTGGPDSRDYDRVRAPEQRRLVSLLRHRRHLEQEKKKNSTLNVCQSAIDDAAGSTWESMKLHPDPKGYRRPLIVVYDEDHNLSDGKTALLLEARA